MYHLTYLCTDDKSPIYTNAQLHSEAIFNTILAQQFFALRFNVLKLCAFYFSYVNHWIIHQRSVRRKF